MNRNVLLISGLLVVAAAWVGPLPALAETSFSAHMLIHMSLVAIGAPLITLGVAGGPWDPARRAPGFFSPIAASLVEFVVVWAWHAPALHHAARHSSVVWFAEQGSFLLSGLWLWLSVFGGDAGSRHTRRAAGFLGLLLTSMHMTLLGSLLALTPRALYHDLDIFDQHLGGAIMLVVGGTSYLVGGIWIIARLLREDVA